MQGSRIFWTTAKSKYTVKNLDFVHHFDGQSLNFVQIGITGMHPDVEAFQRYREQMNELILSKQNKVINRLFNLDTNTYQDGALPAKTKEMLGLVASMVLRCDDCIKYHLGKCKELGVSTAEMYEIFAVANIVGGTIVIPHTRRAAEYWEALQQ